MKIVYFGKKSPKTIRATTLAKYALENDRAKRENALPGNYVSVLVCDVDDTKDYKFYPFKEEDIPDVVADKLLEKCRDIFFKTEIASRRKSQKPDYIPATDGYVGDVHADQIPDLEEQRKIDAKADEGESVEEVIEKARKKTRSRKNEE